MIACDITTPELVDNNSELSGFTATEDDEFDIPDIVDVNKLIGDVMADLATMIKRSGAVIQVADMPVLNLYESEMRQMGLSAFIRS